MTNKKGFTLVEIMIFMVIFAILTMVGSSLLIDVTQNSLRSQVQNEVRQNASKIMEDIGNEIRQAKCVRYVVNPTILYLSDNPDDQYCNGVNSHKVVYSLDSNGALKKNNKLINSTNTAVLDCHTTNATCGTTCTPGLVFSGLTANTTSIDGSSISVTVSVQNSTTATRSDFCAATKLTNTFTPRLY